MCVTHIPRSIVSGHLRVASVRLPAVPAWRGRWHLLLHLSSPEAASTTAQDREEQEATDDGGDGYDDGFVIIDPRFDLAAQGSAFALALISR